MDQHEVKKPRKAVLLKRLEMLVGVQTPRLALHVGKRAHEQHLALRFTNGVDDARNKQVRDVGRVQRARTQHDPIGLTDCLESRLISNDRLGRAQVDGFKGAA